MLETNASFIDIQTVKIHYKTWKDNPKSDWIILLHDALGSVAQWKDFPEKLHQATSLNILAYDRIGHGLSSENNKQRHLNYLEEEAVFLGLVLETLGIHKPHLIGHSDGGSIALLFAASKTYQCKSVISLAAHVLVEEITLHEIRETQKVYHSKLKILLEKFHHEKTDKLFNDWCRTWLSPDFKQWNMLNILPAIEVPVLALQCDKDNYGSGLQLEKIKYFANAKIVELHDCGHQPHAVKPNEVLQEIKQFLLT